MERPSAATEYMFRGPWECDLCGATGSPPTTLEDHLDEEHPHWRSLLSNNETSPTEQ